MRFLYGDSAPFPLGYNFLATLEAFMAAATRIVQLDHESRERLRVADDLAKNRIKGLEALEQFHTVVMRAVQETAQKVQHAHALDYAQRVGAFASAFVDDHRRATLGANERDAGQQSIENESRTNEQRNLLEGFLKVARLPVLATKCSMRLIGEGKDANVQMNALIDNPDGIQTSFTLTTARAPAWASARKISEFIEGVDLTIGVDKSWLRGTVAPKQVNVDDWTITQFEASEENFELVIKKKLTDREAIGLSVRRSEGAPFGRVQYLGHSSTEGLPETLGASDVAHLERLWKALRTAAREVMEHKEQLLSVNLDNAPVFEGRLVVPFVVRLVTMFAPTVREIAKRSPNEFELSLKQETDGGRREEIYLRRDQLVNKLQPLPSSGREVFAPLGLDSWVPGTTTAPPPVSSKGGSSSLAALVHGMPSSRPQGPASQKPPVPPPSASSPSSLPASDPTQVSGPGSRKPPA